MGFMLLIKNIALFFLLISASFLSTSSFAGRSSNFVRNSVNEAGAVHEDEQVRHDEVSDIHERLLRVNTKDYGRYDPAPALSKPRFKLIPN